MILNLNESIIFGLGLNKMSDKNDIWFQGQFSFDYPFTDEKL